MKGLISIGVVAGYVVCSTLAFAGNDAVATDSARSVSSVSIPTDEIADVHFAMISRLTRRTNVHDVSPGTIRVVPTATECGAPTMIKVASTVGGTVSVTLVAFTTNGDRSIVESSTIASFVVAAGETHLPVQLGYLREGRYQLRVSHGKEHDDVPFVVTGN